MLYKKHIPKQQMQKKKTNKSLLSLETMGRKIQSRTLSWYLTSPFQYNIKRHWCPCGFACSVHRSHPYSCLLHSAFHLHDRSITHLFSSFISCLSLLSSTSVFGLSAHAVAVLLAYSHSYSHSKQQSYKRFMICCCCCLYYLLGTN